MPLADLIEEVTERELSLVVLDRQQPAAIADQLERTFAGQPVAVEELPDGAAQSLPDGEDLVVLLAGDEVVATSPLSAVRDAVLMVNSDIYTTGLRELEDADLPDVLVGLAGVPFDLRGYPESNREKLLLIAVSRLIERRAWAADDGRLRTSFQRLSRIDDERGTRRVYERLVEAAVDLHVYGVPDDRPDLDVTVHAGDDENYRRSWFVVFSPEERGEAAALLAWEYEPRHWQGLWTFEAGRVADIEAAIEAELG